MSNEVTKAIDNVRELTPMDMLARAVEQNADLDKLEKLMQLQREWKADRAREAYVEAMNAFRAEAIHVAKTQTVDYTSRKTGERTNYNFAPLHSILAVVVPLLSKHGLSHRWQTGQQENGGINVTCILTHALGHSESTSLMAAPDDSGGKNKIQAIGSTTSYLERYTFMAITGLAARDQDDDGQGATVNPLTDKQVAELEALITEVGADKAKWLRYMKAESVDAIPASQFKRAVETLEAKRGK